MKCHSISVYILTYARLCAFSLQTNVVLRFRQNSVRLVYNSFRVISSSIATNIIAQFLLAQLWLFKSVCKWMKTTNLAPLTVNEPEKKRLWKFSVQLKTYVDFSFVFQSWTFCLKCLHSNSAEQFFINFAFMFFWIQLKLKYAENILDWISYW